MSATSAHPVLTLASLLQGVSVLAARDRRFARIVADYGPPPLWARPQGFTTLTRIILEQQHSLAWSRSTAARLLWHSYLGRRKETGSRRRRREDGESTNRPPSGTHRADIQ
jgi:hypothetical protein